MVLSHHQPRLPSPASTETTPRGQGTPAGTQAWRPPGASPQGVPTGLRKPTLAEAVRQKEEVVQGGPMLSQAEPGKKLTLHEAARLRELEAQHTEPNKKLTLHEAARLKEQQVRLPNSNCHWLRKVPARKNNMSSDRLPSTHSTQSV